MLAANKRFPTVVAAVVLVNLAVQPLTARSATYDYVAPQVAPPIAANLGTAGIAGDIERDRAQPALPRRLSADNDGRK
jgi:hypothetical protein